MYLVKQNQRCISGFALLALTLFSFPVFATPQGISYQGRLTDSGGSPLTGTYNLNFGIYTTPSGGAPQWSEDHVSVNVDGGIFTVILGTMTPFPAGLFQDGDLFLGISIDGGAEANPRQQLLSVPFAQTVETIDGSSGGTIQGQVSIPDGLIVGIGDMVGDSAGVAIGHSNSASGVYSSVAGGEENEATGRNSFVGSGIQNSASGVNSALLGGNQNRTSGELSFIGGGSHVQADGLESVIAGGFYNGAQGEQAAVLGGSFNHADGVVSAIGGGSTNQISADYSVISGGIFNECRDQYGAVVGGGENINYGSYSTILGGFGCQIRDTTSIQSSYSMAFGHNVVLAGVTDVVGLFDGENSGLLAINHDTDDGPISYPIEVGTNSANGNGAHLTAGGVWTNASSKEFKENYTPLDRQELFEKIKSLNIEGWNYRSSEEYHIGPYAEEFVKAFDVGTIDEQTGERVNTYLAAGDVAGVALAGVKGLLAENARLKEQLALNRSQTEDLRKRVKKLEQALEILAKN